MVRIDCSMLEWAVVASKKKAVRIRDLIDSTMTSYGSWKLIVLLKRRRAGHGLPVKVNSPSQWYGWNRVGIHSKLILGAVYFFQILGTRIIYFFLTEWNLLR